MGGESSKAVPFSIFPLQGIILKVACPWWAAKSAIALLETIGLDSGVKSGMNG